MKKLLCSLAALLMLCSMALAEVEEDLTLYLERMRSAFLPLDEQVALYPGTCTLPEENGLQPDAVIALALELLTADLGTDAGAAAADMAVGLICSTRFVVGADMSIQRWEVIFANDPESLQTGYRVLLDFYTDTNELAFFQCHDILDNGNG